MPLSRRIASFVSPANFVVAGQPVDASARPTKAVPSPTSKWSPRRSHWHDQQRRRARRAQGVDRGPPARADAGSRRQHRELRVGREFHCRGAARRRNQGDLHDGTAADLANGRDVTAKGPRRSAALQAAEIDFHDSGQQQGAEAEGRITNFVSPSNFAVGGRTIDASAARFSHGTIADLANGKNVECMARSSAACSRHLPWTSTIEQDRAARIGTRPFRPFHTSSRR